MSLKNFFLICLFLIGCSGPTPVKNNTIPSYEYGKNNTCEDKVGRYLRSDGKLNRDNALNNINNIYHRELPEKIVHVMYAYTINDEQKTLEVKYDFNKQVYQPVLGIRKNEFEETLDTNYQTFQDFHSKMSGKNMVYKESYYEFGSKKLMIEYANEKISKIYLGKDFNCRFDPNPQCSCARFFR